MVASPGKRANGLEAVSREGSAVSKGWSAVSRERPKVSRKRSAPSSWRLCDREVAFGRPAIAGILNVTPDSFSDGGLYERPGAAIRRAYEIAEQGADLLDVGAESTRPGAAPVTAATEWGRLEPVLRGLADFPLPVCVDTSKLEVARRALDEGARAINDVTALRRDPGLAELAARTGAGLVLMHMRGTPRTMQSSTEYEDLVGEVRAALLAARDTAIEAGCDPRQVAVDPGIGFGKSESGSLELLARLDEIAPPDIPVWIGASRKSFLGKLLGTGPDDRVAGSVAAGLAAARRGANVLRVHDVAETRAALEVELSIGAHAASGARG